MPHICYLHEITVCIAVVALNLLSHINNTTYSHSLAAMIRGKYSYRYMPCSLIFGATQRLHSFC
jgi:hypothetical protein